MKNFIAHIAIVVRDYDEAIHFYTEKMGFVLQEDTALSSIKRWVLVRPKGGEGTALLLAKAAGKEQEEAIGNQSGGRVFLFLHTDDFDAQYNLFLQNGIEIVDGPRTESYGRVAVFKDLYGNKWDLIGP